MPFSQMRNLVIGYRPFLVVLLVESGIYMVRGYAQRQAHGICGGGEPAVSLVDIVAQVLGALDNVLRNPVRHHGIRYSRG